MMKARQTVIVTGGNTGLGLEAARAIALSGEGWHVVIACRNHARAADAVRVLSNGTARGAVEAMSLDLMSLASVRAFAQAYTGRNLPPLRGVVLNAGIQIVRGTTHTEDGFEATFGVNHLGHFLLANLLLPQISAPGRIVFVSSGTHDPDQWTGMPAPQLLDAESLANPQAVLQSPIRRRRSGSGGTRRPSSATSSVPTNWQAAWSPVGGMSLSTRSTPA